MPQPGATSLAAPGLQLHAYASVAQYASLQLQAAAMTRLPAAVPWRGLAARMIHVMLMVNKHGQTRLADYAAQLECPATAGDSAT